MRALLMLGLAGPLAAGSVAAAEVEVAVKKVSEAPAIDGKVEKAWDVVKAVKVTASEGPQGDVEITMKVLYTDKDVFFLFQWPDKTASLNRLYEFDGKEWKKAKGGEDRFNLMWDINNTMKEFPVKGCTVACHKQDKKVTLKTNGPSERMDVWHWKAQRSNPAGYADDQWLGHELKKEGDEEIARGNDAKTAGGYSDNWDKEAKRPKYGFKDAVKPGSVLLKKDAVEIKDQKFKAGDRLPREVLDKPTGSRGDIEAKAVWDKGRWTLELKRARDTGDKENDIQFTDPARPYYFGISVHDDGGDEDHSHTGRTALKLLLK
ncbi:MAG TPA: ethylbenzene dehydrogenase-related protein [Vicinamibacteria bacterium]|nr:ethylbenzene dehydrogenase-related protein [Vicinamibacteria bacterium]